MKPKYLGAWLILLAGIVCYGWIADLSPSSWNSIHVVLFVSCCIIGSQLFQLGKNK